MTPSSIDTPPAIEIDRFEELDSTSALARRLVQENHAALRVPRTIVASRQTAGRGRLGRAWASPGGGLWCTLIWPLDPPTSHDALPSGAPRPHPDLQPVRAPTAPGGDVLDGLGLRIGLACTLTIEDTLQRCGIRPEVRLRWPNDVLVDGRKVLGVLVEVLAERGLMWALVGVGINANFDAADLPGELCTRATTLREESGCDVDLGRLLDDLHARLVPALQTRGLDEPTLSAARARLYGVGRPISESSSARELAPGVLIGLSDAGFPLVVSAPVPAQPRPREPSDPR